MDGLKRSRAQELLNNMEQKIFSNIIPKMQVVNILGKLNVNDPISVECIYKIYSLAIQSLFQLINSNILMDLSGINQVELLYYCVGEYFYAVKAKKEDDLKAMLKDEKFYYALASVASDKYITLSMFNYSEKKLANGYIPPVSSLNLYLNFMLNILKNYQKNDPKSTLITDLLIKSVSISRCILNLLINGYETEAFSSWRTLHECECTLILLDKYGDPLINRYLIHMQYGIVFKNSDKEDEKGTIIFNDMKEEMKKFNLKSKDIKKYIEYGWIYEIPDINLQEDIKLNFRDGLQKLAGLSSYSTRYELSSEIIHSTPMLIYSNKQYFFFITLLSVYESFFRLEKIFVNLFQKNVSKEQFQQYINFRNVYYNQLVNIHRREVHNFQNWQKHHKN